MVKVTCSNLLSVKQFKFFFRFSFWTHVNEVIKGNYGITGSFVIRQQNARWLQLVTKYCSKSYVTFSTDLSSDTCWNAQYTIILYKDHDIHGYIRKQFTAAKLFVLLVIVSVPKILSKPKNKSVSRFYLKFIFYPINISQILPYTVRCPYRINQMVPG